VQCEMKVTNLNGSREKPALSYKSGILFSMEADGIMKKTTERQHRNTMEIHVQTG